MSIRCIGRIVHLTGAILFVLALAIGCETTGPTPTATSLQPTRTTAPVLAENCRAHRKLLINSNAPRCRRESESRLVAYDFDPIAEALYALGLLPVLGGQ